MVAALWSVDSRSGKYRYKYRYSHSCSKSSQTERDCSHVITRFRVSAIMTDQSHDWNIAFRIDLHACELPRVHLPPSKPSFKSHTPVYPHDVFQQHEPDRYLRIALGHPRVLAHSPIAFCDQCHQKDCIPERTPIEERRPAKRDQCFLDAKDGGGCQGS